jgi:predicted enzyme related to lactoylglutathione lyase
MFLGLRTALYKVDDLGAAKAWYSRVLGVEPYFAEPFYVGFNVGGFELGLDPDMTGVTSGNSHIAYWGVTNCGTAFHRLVELGATVQEEPRDVGGGIIVATLRDPFGNTLGIIENPHFGAGDAS